MTPSYINDLIPTIVGVQSDYNLRNRHNISNIATRTTLFKKSCIPSTIDMWNSLDINIRQNPTLCGFKNAVKSISPTDKIVPHYLHGNRYLSVLHARLRNKCSNLNEDLYHNYLSINPYCSCSGDCENASHFFFTCIKYKEQRQKLLNTVLKYTDASLSVLLYGDRSLSLVDNINIVEAVQPFIQNTKRFKQNANF